MAKSKTAKTNTAQTNVTLEDALKKENSIDKVKMLNILTSTAKKMDEDEIKEIMKGTSNKSYHLNDLHSIRELGSYRIKNGLPVFPFKNMVLTDEHFPPSY